MEGAVPQEQSPPAKDAQALVKERITKYFAQLTDGCGAPSFHPFCGSNPAFKAFGLSASQIAVLAYKLAVADQTGDLLAAPSASALATSPSKTPAELPYLDLPSLKKMLEEGNSSGNYTLLVRLIGTVCGDPDLLNNSFWKNPMEITYDGSDCGLDEASAAEAFRLLEQAPDNVREVLASALGRLTSALRITAPNLHNIFRLRVFFLLLNSPQLQDPSLHSQLLGPFLICITRLPAKSQNFLKKQFFEKFGADAFQKFLSLFLDFITLRYLEEANPDAFNPNKNAQVTSAVQVMGILYDINKSKHYVKSIAFYSDTIDSTMSPKDDYINYKRGDGFSFCNFPFVLQAETKAHILQIESAVHQYVQRAEAVNLQQLGVPVAPYLVLNVFRQNLIYSSLKQLEQYSARELKKELKVKFVGEEGVDEGGVQKEWFQLLVKKIFDPQFGMFIEDHETRTHWFNNKSRDFEEFELIGKLLGLAIYNGVILDLHFPLVIYKKLLGEKPTIDDLSQTHPSLAHGLKEMIKFEGNVEETFELNFQIQYDNYGVTETFDLVPDGANFAVTNANRDDYVSRYIKYLLEDSVSEQFSAFSKGFRTVCDSDIMKMFTVEELELLICGSPNLDFHELEKTTNYDGGFDEDHPTVRMFWEVVHSLDIEQKKKLLFFTTGSDRAPIGGLGRLNLVLARHGPDSDRLPTSHTCFNHLLLPEYKSKEKLRDNLLKAIENAEGFGML